MRTPLLAANWKMNKTIEEALQFVGPFLQAANAEEGKGLWPEILICPPFTALPALSAALAESSVGLGGQDVFWEKQGAFTGEISPGMLKDAGCTYVIVGHSERRHLLGETDEMVEAKVRAALNEGLRPVICVGETLEEREKGDTYEVCRRMTRLGLAGVKPDEASSVVMAYEPVWAIGTGKEAKPEDAGKVVRHIRETVDAVLGPGGSAQVRVLYGGSVKSANIRQFMLDEDIDGALVGGASLDPVEFARIASEIRKVRPPR